MENHKKSFLFYDLETTGLNVVFDQPVQFASTRLDAGVNHPSLKEGA